MRNRKIAAVLIIAALTAGSAWAIDFSTFPSPIEKGSLLISPNFGLGTFYSGWLSAGREIYLGGGVAVDYALPINFALTLGGEVGFYGAKIGENSDASIGVIPVLARVAWHPNWEVKGLDTYVMGKAGVGIGFWMGEGMDKIDGPVGFAYGFDIGARYFFTDMIGAFAEAGYEYYILTYDMGGWFGSMYAFANKFLTVGMTFKL